MHIALYQILIVVFATIMIIQGFLKFIGKGDNQTLTKLLVRFVVWGGMAIIVTFPDISNVLAKLIGIEGNINAVILTGFFLVFLMIFKLLSAIEKLESQITLLTRKEALQKIKKK